MQGAGRQAGARLLVRFVGRLASFIVGSPSSSSSSSFFLCKRLIFFPQKQVFLSETSGGLPVFRSHSLGLSGLLGCLLGRLQRLLRGEKLVEQRRWIHVARLSWLPACLAACLFFAHSHLFLSYTRRQPERPMTSRADVWTRVRQ